MSGEPMGVGEDLVRSDVTPRLNAVRQLVACIETGRLGDSPVPAEVYLCIYKLLDRAEAFALEAVGGETER